MTAIRKVTLTVETTDGNVHTLVEEGHVTGGNPRFVGKEMRGIVHSLGDRMWGVLRSLYGSQEGVWH